MRKTLVSYLYMILNGTFAVVSSCTDYSGTESTTNPLENTGTGPMGNQKL